MWKGRSGVIASERVYGPSGYDTPYISTGQLKYWISSNQPLNYRSDFWNKESATAATTDVVITDTLDPNLDWGTLQFTEIGFLDWKASPEPGQYFDIDISNVSINS